MGLGDEIMASGQARVESERIGGPVHILDGAGKPRWSNLWEGLGWIARPGEKAAGSVTNGVGCRPYIQYPFTVESGFRPSGWRARDHRGALHLTDGERAWARGSAPADPFVLIEPEVQPSSSPNKQWGKARWRELIRMNQDICFVQPLHAGPAIEGAVGVACESFRHAAALLDRAVLSVLPEGGLHHAAAALRRPAVVLFGGFTPVASTGYEDQINIADDGPGSPCGRYLPCAHCAAIWDKLSPATVSVALLKGLAAA